MSKDNAHVYRPDFQSESEFWGFWAPRCLSRVQEHLVTRNPLTLIKEEANPCSRNTKTMHMYKG